MIGRVLRTGLLGKARALLHGLGHKGEYPSRSHEFEPFCISSDLVDEHGNTLSRTTRRGHLCHVCGATSVIGDLPCIAGKYFSK